MENGSVLYKIHKVKFRGMKQKIRFLSENEIIEDGDFQALIYAYETDFSADYTHFVGKAYIYFDRYQWARSACPGDVVSEHHLFGDNVGSRVYFRII